MKHVFRTIAAILAASLLSACGPDTGEGAKPAPRFTVRPLAPPPAARLKIGFPGDSFDPSMTAAFTKETKTQIIAAPLPSPDRLLAGLRAGEEWDVLLIPDILLHRMIREGLLAPLPQPALTGVKEEFLHPFQDPANRYSIAYVWRVAGIAWRNDSFPAAPEGWSLLFPTPPDANPLRSRLAIPGDEPLVALAAALLCAGQSPNATQPEIIAAAARLFPTSGQNRALQAETKVTVEGLINGTIAASLLWSDLAAQASRKNPAVKFAVPREGAIRQTESLVIPASSCHPESAGALVNALLAIPSATAYAESRRTLSAVKNVPVPAERLLPAGAAYFDLDDTAITPAERETALRSWASLTTAAPAPPAPEPPPATPAPPPDPALSTPPTTPLQLMQPIPLTPN